MILFKKAGQLSEYLETQRKKTLSVGFCPTMGALHAGHLSLITASKNQNEITVASIFVNPAQFNDPKDFQKYPITIEQDIDMLEETGCDILFLPSVSEIYPHGFKKTKHYDLGFLETVLEGKYRPGHYQGVCMVVERLLEIVMPDNLYLGQKDYQQCMVISRLIELMNLKKKIKPIICPTMREKDGLAMSSRNMRLNETERKKATEIFKALSFIKTNLKPGNIEQLKSNAVMMLEKSGFRSDYISVAGAVTLEEISGWDGKQKLVVLAAAYLNEIRLIDNLILN